MANRGDGMHKQHPWAGKTHDRANLFAHFGLVAVNAAVGAEGFGFHKRAVLRSAAGVRFQSGAVGAERAARVMLFAAVERDHLGDHALFPLALQGDILHQLILPCSTE